MISSSIPSVLSKVTIGLSSHESVLEQVKLFLSSLPSSVKLSDIAEQTITVFLSVLALIKAILYKFL